MSKIDTKIFGKEVKDLNLLNNINTTIPIKYPSSWGGNHVETVIKLIRINVEAYREKIKENIKYITKPVYSAYSSNETKLSDLMGGRIDRVGFGVLMYTHSSGTLVTTYYAMDLKKSIFFTLTFIDGSVIDFHATTIGDESVHFTPWKTLDNHYEDLLFMDKAMELNFMVDNMDIEIESLKARTKRKDKRCVYENHTNNDIQIITSKHFNQLEKMGAFKVRGHFRWQAYGENMKDRKLIWVSDFLKSGYSIKQTVCESE